MNVTNVGIVGCGEVTQILHLPALAQLPAQFAVTAVCDASAEVLHAVGERCGSSVTRFNDYRDLIASPKVDVVLVANPDIYHAHTAITAMEAGKHVFIEKPMCITLAEADRLESVQRKTGRIVQIGYMRRFAGAFLEAVAMAAHERENVRYARIHDFFGAPGAVTNSTSVITRPTDLSAEISAELRDIRFDKIVEATGSTDPRIQMSYSVLLGLSTHDISAMRELLGRPKRLIYAAHRYDGRNVSAAFDYGDFICEFATGMDDLPRFDTFMEVYLQDKTIRLEYETAYVRSLPAKLVVTSPLGVEGLTKTVSFPTRTDTFVLEWRSLHASLHGGPGPKSSISDSRADLEIFADIITAIAAENWQPTQNGSLKK